MLRIPGTRLLARGRTPTTNLFSFSHRNANLQNVRHRVTWSWPRPRPQPHAQSRGSSARSNSNSNSNKQKSGKTATATATATTTTVLKAAATAAGAILLAAARPLDAPLPGEKQNQSRAAWDKVKASGDLDAARRLCWADCVVFLRHYFHGRPVDEGPALERDIVVDEGVYLARADTRVFWQAVPEHCRRRSRRANPGSGADDSKSNGKEEGKDEKGEEEEDEPLPVVGVAVNGFFGAKIHNLRDADDEHHRSLAERREALIREQLAEARLEPWKAEGRFPGNGRCFVVIWYFDIICFHVYEADGTFTPWDMEDVTSDHWARDAFAIYNYG